MGEVCRKVYCVQASMDRWTLRNAIIDNNIIWLFYITHDISFLSIKLNKNLDVKPTLVSNAIIIKKYDFILIKMNILRY